MHDIVIKKAVSEELPQIMEIKKEAHALYVENRPDIYKDSDVLYTDDFIKGYFQDKDKLIVLAKDNDLAAGYVLVQLHAVDLPMMVKRKYVYIHDLAVLKAYRKNGIATKMIEYIRRFAEENGAEKVELAVHIFNEDALSLYEKNGFKPRAIRMEMDV